MALRLITWAWQQETPDAGTQLVLTRLADMASDAGQCWPSTATLARDCRMSARTVFRAIDKLIDLELIRKESRTRRHGGQTSNLYILLADGAFLRPDGDGDDRPANLADRAMTDCQGGSDADGRAGLPTVSPHEPSLKQSGKPKRDFSIAQDGWLGPPAILHELARHHGQDFAVGYLKRASWDDATGMILVRTGVARDKLKGALSPRDWEALGVKDIAREVSE